jgi:sulfur transfer complex TusBCD TusB component (DsrH family)
MQTNYRQITVACPICGIEKELNIPEAVFSQKKFGTIKIQVPVMAVCPDHQFIVFVDSKGIIRGYEKIDLQMAIPSEETEKEKRGIITLRKLIQMYGLYGVFNLIHAKIFNYPAYIMINNESENITDLMNIIGDSILPDQYKGTAKVDFILENDYDKIKLKEKNALVLDSLKHILNTPWDEKLKFEEDLIKKAIEIIDEEEQLLLMQQGIAKFINEAEYTKTLLENIREIYEDELIERISKEMMVPKVTHYRLLLIKQFIKQRYSSKLASKIKNKVEEFLDLL